MESFIHPGWIDEALLVNRVAVGTFFAISGYHKMFVPERHASLVATLKKDNIPLVGVNEWFVPAVEFTAGASLVMGWLTPLCAALLATVCIVACLCDGLKRIKEYAPINWADWLDDLLYLPEVLLLVMLGISLAAGPGAYSIDYLVWR